MFALGAVQCVNYDGIYFEFTFKDVGRDNFQIRPFDKSRFGDLGKDGVDFNCDAKAGLFGNRFSEGTSATTHFENDVVFLDIGGVNKQTHKVKVDEEMLAEPLIGPDARGEKQLFNLPFTLH